MLRRSLWLVALAMSFYIAGSLIAGIWLAEMTLHPTRRAVLLEPRFAATVQRLSHSGIENIALNIAGGTTLKAWYIQPDDWNNASVIVLHGLADNREGAAGYAEMFLDAGYAVLVPDSRAHGESGGSIATYGVLEKNDVNSWSKWLLRRSTPCVYLLGESMGAAIALQAAEVTPGLCGIVEESSFSTFREIAYDRVSQSTGFGLTFSRTIARPMLEGALLYTRLRYGVDLTDAQPKTSLARTRVPVLLIADQEDRNIPPRHAALLMQSANTCDALWQVPDAGHGDAARVAHQEFQNRVLGWFQSHQIPAN